MRMKRNMSGVDGTELAFCLNEEDLRLTHFPHPSSSKCVAFSSHFDFVFHVIYTRRNHLHHHCVACAQFVIPVYEDVPGS